MKNAVYRVSPQGTVGRDSFGGHGTPAAHLRFTGRLSVVVQNGEVLKSGYEEGYFRQH
jgi:hypothetical protein